MLWFSYTYIHFTLRTLIKNKDTKCYDQLLFDLFYENVTETPQKPFLHTNKNK